MENRKANSDRKPTDKAIYLLTVTIEYLIYSNLSQGVSFIIKEPNSSEIISNPIIIEKPVKDTSPTIKKDSVPPIKRKKIYNSGIKEVREICVKPIFSPEETLMPRSALLELSESNIHTEVTFISKRLKSTKAKISYSGLERHMKYK